MLDSACDSYAVDYLRRANGKLAGVAYAHIVGHCNAFSACIRSIKGKDARSHTLRCKCIGAVGVFGERDDAIDRACLLRNSAQAAVCLRVDCGGVLYEDIHHPARAAFLPAGDDGKLTPGAREIRLFCVRVEGDFYHVHARGHIAEAVGYGVCILVQRDSAA